MNSFDLRRSFRALARTPTFTFLTVLTLALAIGANSAIFSLVHGVLIKPLPYPEAERLANVEMTAPGIGVEELVHSQDTFLHFEKLNKSFESMGMHDITAVNLTGSGEPERVREGRFTVPVLRILKVEPALGRAFAPGEDEPGAEPVALLSQELWSKRYGSSRDVLDQSLQIDGVEHRIIGVMPAGFTFPRPEVEVWVPLTYDRADPDDGNFNYEVVARLLPGVTPEQAQRDLDTYVPLLAEEDPANGMSLEIIQQARLANVVTSLQDDIVGDVGTSLWILLGTVGLILLIACANVANLFLVRAEGRRQEVAVRTALGAGRRQLAGFFLAESTLLALGGGLAGLVLAALAIEALRALAPGNIPRLNEIGLDPAVLAFTLALTAFTAFAFGLAPAFRLGGERLAAVLKAGGRATAGKARNRARGALVVEQIALALVLLVGSGLMLRSFNALAQIDPGFRPDNLLTLRIALPRSWGDEPADAAAFFDQLSEEVAALPGVLSVGSTDVLPLSGSESAQGTAVEDAYPRAPNELPNIVPYNFASPGYIETMGIPLLAGRTFDARDHQSDSRVALVSDTLAKQLWPGEDPLGKRLGPDFENEPPEWFTVVGVVGSVRNRSLTDEPAKMLYYPVLHGGENGWSIRSRSLVIRTEGDPLALADAVREKVWAVDGDLPVANVTTVQRMVDLSTSRTTFTLVLLALASVIALVLGVVGLYGVIRYIVAQRTHEIGVRMALGANRGDVSGMVLKQGLVLTALGLAVGLAAALGLTRLMESLLYGVDSTDPLTFAVVPVLLLGVAMLATYLPSRRATAIQPVEALRGE